MSDICNLYASLNVHEIGYVLYKKNMFVGTISPLHKTFRAKFLGLLLLLFIIIKISLCCVLFVYVCFYFSFLRVLSL
jgi:hypothetical protein